MSPKISNLISNFSDFYYKLRKNSDCDSPFHRTVFDDVDVVNGRMTRSMTLILLIIAILTIWMNMGVLVRTYKLIRRGSDVKPVFYFIGNLAASDFLVGFYIVAVLCIDLINLSRKWRENYCGILAASVITACQETICSITLIAFDKYIFICHGISYNSIVTDRRVKISLTISWLLSLLIGFLPLLSLHENIDCGCNFILYINKTFSIILFLTAVFIPLVVIVSLYSVILGLAIKIKRQIVDSIPATPTSLRKSYIRFTKSKKSRKSNSSVKTDTTYISNRIIIDNSPSQVACKPSIPLTLIENRGISEKLTVEAEESDMGTSKCFKDSRFSEGPISPDETDCAQAPRLDNNQYESIQKSSTDVCHTVQIHCEISKGYEQATYKPEFPVSSVSRNSQIPDLNNIDLMHTTEESNLTRIRTNLSRLKNHYNKIANNTKDKVLFLKKCRAVKTIALIVFGFAITYIPFVTGSMVFKTQKVKDYRLFKSLNNLLYVAVVLNSLLNPFVYAYGYREFRIRTKKYKFDILKCFSRKNRR